MRGFSLGQIVEAGRKRVEALRPGAALLEDAAASSCRLACRDLAAALRRSDRIPVIAEIKRRSPGSGFLSKVPDPGPRAACYERGGAAAVSVLTEEDFFEGDIDDLARARAATGIPVLRKDFVLDRLQVLESRLAGADAVLLIAAILPGRLLGELFEACTTLGMTPLVEVHDERELERAVMLGPSIIGVNNRNLETMEIDLSTTERLVPLIPGGIVRVSESGLRNPDDMQRLMCAGADAFLVGTALMASSDPERLLARLTGLSRPS